MLKLLLTLFLLAATLPPYPKTPMIPTVDTYPDGVKVTDDYRWLEDSASPQVQQWVQEQNNYTRSYLQALSNREQVRAEVRRTLIERPPSVNAIHHAAGKLFALRLEPPKTQPSLVVLDSPTASSKVILDLNALDAKGTTAIDWFVPSPDGKLVAVSLSKNGSEKGDLFIYEVATGQRKFESIPWVQNGTAGGAVAWLHDSSGFYYTRYPREGQRPKEDLGFYQQIFLHKLDTPESKDPYSLGKDFPRIAEAELESLSSAKRIVASIQNGDGGEYAHYVLDEGGNWKQLTKFEDKVKQVAAAKDGSLYLRSIAREPRGELLRLPPGEMSLSKAERLYTPPKGVLEHFVVTGSAIYIDELDGGPSRLLRMDLAGQSIGEIPIPPISAVYALVPLEEERLLFSAGSYTRSLAWFLYDAKTGKVAVTDLNKPHPIRFDDAEVVREYATSKDGTKVPVNILRKKGTRLDGTNKVLLYAYGGYGVNLSPAFSSRTRILLDHGFTFVIANIRGGSEYGEAWHLAGNLLNKQNVFDDFIACAEHLIKTGYTKPEKLAIEGGSNGGLLMGAALTQRPELFRAVLSYVGIYDMLRVELHTNGAFNVTEFGSVKVPEQFKVLYGYSPYHRVRNGVKYPAVYLTAGANDPRVDPMQPRKMAARLQAATSSGLPVLFQSDESGHGMGSSLEVAIGRSSSALLFLFDQIQ